MKKEGGDGPLIIVLMHLLTMNVEEKKGDLVVEEGAVP